jgi:hypothetical protein
MFLERETSQQLTAILQAGILAPYQGKMDIFIPN